MTPWLFEDPKKWLDAEIDLATQHKAPEPTAMALATADADGYPDVRVVLFKGWKDSGLCFFTNYDSPKSQHLIQNPKCTVNFYWPSLFRQVRIRGVVEKLPLKESQEYFSTRPRLSQIGAWSSLQSQEIPNDQWLDQRVMEYTKKFETDLAIPCPPYWGGFVLNPLKYEFWVGQEGRLHQRFIFERFSTSQATWTQKRLSP